MPTPSSPTFSRPAKYDAWNRLVSFDVGNSAKAYAYDPLGRRIRRQEAFTVTHFYYNDRWQVLTETNGAGQATATYLYHPHYVDAVAVRLTAAARPATENEHFYLQDALFNVTALVDKGSKAVVERYAYQPYGRATPLTPTYGPRNGPLTKKAGAG